jgi:hypothetical protein
MQHTRIRAYCQSAQTPLPFIVLAYRTVTAPGAVIMAVIMASGSGGSGPAHNPSNTPIAGDGPCRANTDATLIGYGIPG